VAALSPNLSMICMPFTSATEFFALGVKLS